MTILRFALISFKYEWDTLILTIKSTGSKLFWIESKVSLKQKNTEFQTRPNTQYRLG